MHTFIDEAGAFLPSASLQGICCDCPL